MIMSARSARVLQAVVLCGGLGSRLGALTAATPKPLLPVAGQPFLQRLLFEIRRFGVERVLLLAGHLANEIEQFAAAVAPQLDLEIEVAVETEPAGTGGGLWRARARLDERFFLFNGDSWFDVNLLDLALLAETSDALVAMALRRVANAARHGVVEQQGERVGGFRERGSAGPGLVNGGVYVVSRGIIDHLTPNCSLEADVFAPLAGAGRVSGRIYEGFFLDIGIPEDYRRAQSDIPAAQRRGAVFLDRDGVLNVDNGYVGGVERFEWLPTARAAMKQINDRGFFAFVVTNQSGVARGLYSEDDVRALHEHMQADLLRIGAHVDDFRFCPFHPEGTVAAYRRDSDWRKPAPGMLKDLIANWPVDLSRSVMIGDQERDILAGAAAGVRTHLLNNSDDLEQALTRLLPRSA
jgi:D-glycero-D-manno-heptose 1,7-bisphosphate phosphatase